MLNLVCSPRSAVERDRKNLLSFMSHPAFAREPLPDHEQKQAALSYLNEAWAEARHDGVDGDCLAQASLFAALAELVGTYGEDAVAKFVEGFPGRIRNGEFSVDISRQSVFLEAVSLAENAPATRAGPVSAAVRNTLPSRYGSILSVAFMLG